MLGPARRRRGRCPRPTGGSAAAGTTTACPCAARGARTRVSAAPPPSSSSSCSTSPRPDDEAGLALDRERGAVLAARGPELAARLRQRLLGQALDDVTRRAGEQHEQRQPAPAKSGQVETPGGVGEV
jgi:hypothetical protein